MLSSPHAKHVRATWVVDRLVTAMTKRMKPMAVFGVLDTTIRPA